VRNGFSARGGAPAPGRCPAVASLELVYFPNRLTPEQLRNVARRAEAAGLEALWSTEEDYDSFVYNQLVATATERVRVGSSIARYYKRHPLLVAESAVALDRLAPGRYVIGLGTGPVRRADPAIKLQRWGSDPGNAVERLEEYVDLVRLALSGEEMNFEGEFYAVERIRLDPVPAEPIPIYLSAGGPKLCRLAGRTADGVFFTFVGEQLTRERIELVRGEALASGRDPAAVEISGSVPVCVHEDREVARSWYRRYLASFYLALPHYQQLFAANGFPEAAEEVVQRLAAGDVDGASAAIPDQAVDELALAGTPAECVERLPGFFARGLDAAKLYPVPIDDDWAAAYLATVDLFRAR
jgi:alkanesulfonate monooxygenase SsuD/methylene tetrahydromethanopterin reductase-like flavin-dependent oxidoreductase (luciferase family)